MDLQTIKYAAKVFEIAPIRVHHLVIKGIIKRHIITGEYLKQKHIRVDVEEISKYLLNNPEKLEEWTNKYRISQEKLIEVFDKI